MPLRCVRRTGTLLVGGGRAAVEACVPVGAPPSTRWNVWSRSSESATPPSPTLRRRPLGRAAPPAPRDPRHRYGRRPPLGRDPERARRPRREGHRGGGGARRPHPHGEGVRRSHRRRAQPVALHKVDHSTVLNPILFQKGIKSLLGVPLLAHGEMVGVMHVGTMSRRRFTKDEVELLQLVADRVASRSTSACRTRPRRARGVPADVPPRGPAVHAGTARGDAVPAGRHRRRRRWRLVRQFVLPGGEIVLVIGDVAGHGLPAASLMGKCATPSARTR